MNKLSKGISRYSNKSRANQKFIGCTESKKRFKSLMHLITVLNFIFRVMQILKHLFF
jgi:hypothetical protein